MKKCSSQRVLVVDDDVGCRQFYATIVTECFPAVNVDYAANGEDAFDLFSANHYAAIMMDVHMPVQNGAVAARLIGEFCVREEWEVPLILLLSHYVPPAWLVGAMGPGTLTRLFPKPVKSDELITALRLKLTNK